MFLLLRRQKVEKWLAFAYAALVCVGAIIFGTIISMNFEESIIKISFDSLRGVAGVGLVLIASYFAFRNHFKAILHAVILSLPLMYGLAKIGCTVAGCCHGIAYDGPFALTYDEAKYFPIQPLESIVFLLIYSLGLALYIWKKKDPMQLVICLSLSSKFLLDFLRDERGGYLSRNQIIILIYAAIWTVVNFYLRIRKKNK